MRKKMRNEVNIWDLACVVSSVQSAPNVNPNPIPLVGSCGLEKDKDQRTNNTIISQVELLWILHLPCQSSNFHFQFRAVGASRPKATAQRSIKFPLSIAAPSP